MSPPPLDTRAAVKWSGIKSGLGTKKVGDPWCNGLVWTIDCFVFMKVQSHHGFREHFYAMDLVFSPLETRPLITGLMECLLFTVSLLSTVGQSLKLICCIRCYLAPLCGFMLKETQISADTQTILYIYFTSFCQVKYITEANSSGVIRT